MGHPCEGILLHELGILTVQQFSSTGEAIIFAIQSETEGTSVNLKCQFSPTSMAVFEIQWYLKVSIITNFAKLHIGRAE